MGMTQWFSDTHSWISASRAGWRREGLPWKGIVVKGSRGFFSSRIFIRVDSSICSFDVGSFIGFFIIL